MHVGSDGDEVGNKARKQLGDEIGNEEGNDDRKLGWEVLVGNGFGSEVWEFPTSLHILFVCMTTPDFNPYYRVSLGALWLAGAVWATNRCSPVLFSWGLQVQLALRSLLGALWPQQEQGRTQIDARQSFWLLPNRCSTEITVCC